MKNKKCVIFMNEQIRLKKPKKPVIVVQQGRKQRETNSVNLFNHVEGASGAPRVLVVEDHLYVIGDNIEVKYDPKGCPAVKTHSVKAWIEVS